jgi:DNA-directed RNA polymerase subunit D
MDTKLLFHNKEKIVFLIKETDYFFVNTIRRIIIEEVPTLAIEDITINKNSSALYDEMIAHRLGLIPLKTDLKSYTLTKECKCKGEGCARCSLNIILKAKGPCTVYSENLKTRDPKIKSIYAKIPIIKLLKDQELELEAKAILGQGKDHIKFSPGLAFYRGYPEIKTTKDSNVKKALEQCNNLILKNNQLEIKNLLEWNEACEEICEKNNINIISSKEDFIFTIESWGQLNPIEILNQASDLFEEKLNDFQKTLTKIKS